MENEILGVITKSFKEKIENGDFKKIVDKKLEDMMSSVLDDLVRWNGPVKDYFKKQMEEIMMGVVKDTDFTEYCNVIKGIINQALPQTALPEYKTFVEGLQATLGKPTPKWNEKVKVSDIFNEYVKYVEEQSFSDDDLEDIDDGSSYINLAMRIEEDDNSYYTTAYKLCFYIDGHYNGDEDDYKFEVELTKSYGGEHHIRFQKDKVSDYRHLLSFELYLLQLSNSFTDIVVDEECCDGYATISNIEY